MRIAEFFNMANDGYNGCKGLNRIGHDAHLFYKFPTFPTGLPEWEDSEVDLSNLGRDLNDPNIAAFKWDYPSWLHPFATMGHGFRMALNACSSASKFEIIVGHYPFAQWLRTVKEQGEQDNVQPLEMSKPWIPYEAGMIRYMTLETGGFSHGQADWQQIQNMKYGYGLASKILYTNVDMRPYFQALGMLPKAVYAPLAVDTTKYVPAKQPPDKNHLVFLHPTRHYHWEKGNDRVIAAFAEYVKRNPTAELRMCGWGGEDLSMSKMMVYRYNLSRNVTWLPLIDKTRLIQEYQNADVVFDQFIYPAAGTTTPEAMSCEKPVVSKMSIPLWEQHHDGRHPPIFSAEEPQEIYEAMKFFESEYMRKDWGEKSRDWVQTEQDCSVVARKEVEIFKQVIELG